MNDEYIEYLLEAFIEEQIKFRTEMVTKILNSEICHEEIDEINKEFLKESHRLFGIKSSKHLIIKKINTIAQSIAVRKRMRERLNSIIDNSSN